MNHNGTTTMSLVSEIHRYRIGDIAVTVLHDGFRVIPLDNYLANAGKDELTGTLADAGLPTDRLRNTYAPIVLTTGGKQVLIDTGNGEAMFDAEQGRARPAASTISPPPASTATPSTRW